MWHAISIFGKLLFYFIRTNFTATFIIYEKAGVGDPRFGQSEQDLRNKRNGHCQTSTPARMLDVRAVPVEPDLTRAGIPIAESNPVGEEAISRKPSKGLRIQVFIRDY